jgi:23S rRNA (cytosine1962-C5)-methyltransferase
MPNAVQVYLKKGEEQRIVQGHPWVYSNEILTTNGSVKTGMLVHVFDFKHQFIGQGVINPQSKIRVRLLTWKMEEVIDASLIRKKVFQAIERRKKIVPDIFKGGLRLIFSESDGLPGITADAYEGHVVIACMSAGMRVFLDEIVQALKECHFKSIFEKSVGDICRKEGMPEIQRWWTHEQSFPYRFLEGQAMLDIFPDQGHKTGFYLDYRSARQRILPFCKNKKVFEGFCYEGALAIQAALEGAQVIGWDTSDRALNQARANAQLNGVESQIQFERRDSFKEIKKDVFSEHFGIVILDPPPLAKSVHDLPQASLALQQLIEASLTFLEPGGILMISTCSFHFSWLILETTIQQALSHMQRRFQLLDRIMQPLDHPSLISIPETEYLRTLLLKEVD